MFILDGVVHHSEFSHCNQFSPFFFGHIHIGASSFVIPREEIKFVKQGSEENVDLENVPANTLIGSVYSHLTSS